MSKIICDKCNHSFKVNLKDIKTYFIDDIEIKYFKCRKCKERYIISFEDDKLKEMKKNYNEMLNEEKEYRANGLDYKETPLWLMVDSFNNLVEYQNKLKVKVYGETICQ
ncbi:hypothetical protein NMF85_10660 [Clostridioides difficile]|uniref:hypothetical protein n=1 Tax=Clostridioides difficile TaxID=1496 RepID=UPI00142FBE2C|nr:hypothetical protein [Clostridioides difficile]MCK3747761.1 hypothetical protein [Clostridioides difficile]MCP8397048.1 hypothetical protein [Clostridioides difficile]MCP8415768.1 hypothetical protein [Clostridioides difficile]MCP8493762.1 hypothetical protein [Clostridioides difficile]MCP8656854.1 hypothetical protein [Clostridioides difficile]